MSEERFHALVAATAQILWVVSVEGSVLSDNSSWFTYTGLSREESGGGAWLKAVHPDDRERTLAAWNQAVAARSHYSVEYRIRRHDGVYRMFAVQGAPIFNEDGSIREWVGACTDITERKETELALRVSEQRLRTTFDDAPNGVAIVGLEGKLLRVNRAFCEIVGYTPKELTSLSFQDISHPDDRQAGVDLAARLIRGEIPRYELAKRYIRKDGSIVHVMLYVSVVRDRDGTPLNFISQILDVTERKRDQDALRMNDERFRLLTAHLPVGVFQTDADGRPTYVNARFRDFFDVGPDEDLGSSWIASVHPDDRARFLAAWEDLMKNPRELWTEYRFQRRDGDVRWISSNMAPMRDEAGKLLGYFGSLTDITSQKVAEERARQSHERLIQAQRAALDELSTPLIPIHDEIMVMPLIGGVDKQRADRVLHALLAGIGAHRTRIAILDITGVPTVDEQVADALIGSARAVSLLGAQMVLSGIRPEVAQTLTSIGADLRGVVTCGNLQAAIAYAMSAARRRA